jgi:Ca-activated chloride channel homolog
MRIKTVILLWVSTALFFGAAHADSFNGMVKKGNSAFTGGDFKQALEFYRQAEAERPETPELQYNIGSALYKEGKYEEAADKLEKSFVTEDIKNEAKGHYNLGNVYYRTGDYQKAIASYQKALELAPDDIDAKYNLELARKMLKEQLKPQQQKDNKQQQQQQKDQQQKQDQQDKQDQQKQQEQEQQQPQDQQQNQQKAQQMDKNEMSKEDAERILNALKDDEKDLQKDVHRMQGPAVDEGNDW